MGKCGILFTRDDFNDVTGCLKSEYHNDNHICKTNEGKFISWEDDYSCDCGCWDEFEDSCGSQPCIVYYEVTDRDILKELNMV